MVNSRSQMRSEQGPLKELPFTALLTPSTEGVVDWNLVQEGLRVKSLLSLNVRGTARLTRAAIGGGVP